MIQTVTETDIMTALRTVLLGILPSGYDVLRSQANRVPQPKGPDFVMMTPLRYARLSTNRTSWAGLTPTTVNVATPTQVDVQLDVYGPKAQDMGTLIHMLFRDAFMCDQFTAANALIQPLDASAPQQTAFVNAEAQYEDRRILTVSLQVNAAVNVPQDFADSIAIASITQLP